MANLITAQEVIELAFAENSNMREESISDTSIRIAEIKYIKPVFGDMYSMLGTTYSDFTNEYIKPALAYFVKCEIVSSIAIDMSNAGIAVANPQYQSAASDKQRQRLYDSEMSKAKVLLDDALAYISAHAEEFPDFVGVTPKRHPRIGGIVLGGGISPRTKTLPGDAVSRKDVELLDANIKELSQTVNEQGEDIAQIRKEVADIDVEQMVQVTYGELREIKTLGALKKGAYYRITDFVTATTQSNTRSAGHPFDIIVMALDAHTLSKEAMAIQHEGDTYFANNDLAAWQVWYDFDNNTSRCLWAKKWVDEAPQKWSCQWGIIEEKLNNDASTNYTTAVVEGKTKYLYKPASPTNYLDGKSFYERVVASSIDSYEGLIFEADGAPYYDGDEENPSWYWDTVGDIRVKTADGTQIATLHNDGESFYTDSRDSSDTYGIEFNPQPVEGEGEVYYYTPTYGIEDWWENVQGGSANIYENIPYTGSNDVLFYAFDSVLPKSSKMVAEVYSPETNKVYLYEGGVLDTITYTAYTAPVEGHKGVIYRLIDEFGNDCPYDFKNIQFFDGGTYFFTFSASGKDSSLLSRVCDNKIEHYSAKLLPTIFKAESKHNRIQRVDASNSREFIFEQSATYNDIRATSDEARIIAKGAFDANMILIRASLTANGAFSNNFVQYLSTTMEVNGSMYACQLDTMARNSVPLSINVGRIQQCAIYGCGTFTIANANGSVTGTMGYSTINLGMNGSNVKLLWDKTASLNSRIEGLEIKAYNWGTSEVVCDITNRPVNATYPLTIAKDSSGNVKAWCEADLVE